ncbi:MAG: hypothetical protein II583_00655, partial [Oscillospiraceae bacterium]|nr:hypothetical protein [Oscillospiraceae bacterium]
FTQNFANKAPNEVLLGQIPTDGIEYYQMSPDERATYNYLYATDKTKADEYMEWLYPQLTERQRDLETKAVHDWTQENAAHAIVGNVASVLASPLKALSYGSQVADLINTGKIDENAGYNRYSYLNNAVREATSENWGEVGTFAYQTGMSMADFLWNAFITGGLSGAGAVAKNLSLAIMGASSAADTVIEQKDRGMDDARAFTLGTVAGLAEIVTEKVSLEALLNPDLSKGAFSYIIKNVLAEGSEEGASDLINDFADVLYDLISGQDKSKWLETVKAYRAQGYTDSEAFGRALADRAGEVGLDMLGGALSGGVMAGGSIAINAYQNGKLVKEGLKAPEGSEIRKVAEQMKTELNAGQKVSQAEYAKLGQLIHANTQFRDILNTELNEQKNTASAGETVNIRTLLNETEEQKSARLSGAEITVTESTHDNSKEFSPVKNIKLKISEAKKLLLPIMEKLGISPSQYSNSALDIEFHYSRSGAGRSIAHQFSETNGDYVDFAKVQSSLKELCQNAYPLEAHFDEKPKTADNHVTGVVTLASVLRTSEGIVPVRMTVKFYDNTNPRLHVVINQAISESGSTFIHDEWTQSAHISTENAPATMTITDFFKLVNGSEEFTKRIPDSITGKHFDNAKSAPYNEGKASRREENYGGEEIHLREGGKRLDRESAGESVRSMAKETGGAESRYEKAGSGDGEEAQRVVGRKVTPAELGIKNGSRTETVYVVDGEDSEYLRSLKAEAKKRGLNVTLFAGNNLTIGNKSARGYINGDRVYVRIDHPQFRAEQILRHEIGHDKIAKGEIDLVKVKAETRRKAERLFGKNGIDRISEKYASAYDGMTAEEAFEEMVCDALGEMNVFADELSRRYYEAYEAFLAELREKARGSKFNNRDRPSTTLIANVTPAKYSSQAEVLGLDVDWMNDFSSIKDQLLKHREDINSMKPVAEVEYVHGSKETVVDSIMDQLPYIGGPNIKNSGVSFVFDIEGAKSISTHAKTDKVKAAAIAAPYAAKYGKLIAGQKNHEKTGLTTLTFGAPVIINGMPVIVGVAIQFQKNGRPRAVNVELQDGEKFKIRKIEAPRGTRSRVNRYSQGTTLLTRNASKSTILQSPGKVNTASLEKGTAGIDLPETGRTSREITGSNTREAGKSSGAAKEKFSSAKRGSNRGRSIETATMENNRFERLRNYGDALPTAWYAYTFDYFYVYINRSFMDYRVIAKIPNTEENGELFSYLERELESDAYGAAGRYIRMVTSS